MVRSLLVEIGVQCDNHGVLSLQQNRFPWMPTPPDFLPALYARMKALTSVRQARPLVQPCLRAILAVGVGRVGLKPRACLPLEDRLDFFGSRPTTNALAKQAARQAGIGPIEVVQPGRVPKLAFNHAR